MSASEALNKFINLFISLGFSNGFKFTGSDEGNESGAAQIYMAFAENPFVSSTLIPTTAR